MKRMLFAAALSLLSISGLAAPETYKYADRDSVSLYMDVYPAGKGNNGYTILYMFGGGFLSGTRNSEYNAQFCTELSARGYTVVAIDYRLGLKGDTAQGLKKIDSLSKAIDIAVEDCCSAVVYLVENAAKLSIDPKKIILSGGSAGAISVLQTDYCHANGLAPAAQLPEDLRFAGIIAYSGAVFSHEGPITYRKHDPAPTMMLHGDADQVVPYKIIAFGDLHFTGSSKLAARFRKLGHSYCMVRFPKLGHEVNCALRLKSYELLDTFVSYFIKSGKPLQWDMSIADADFPPTEVSSVSLMELAEDPQAVDFYKLTINRKQP